MVEWSIFNEIFAVAFNVLYFVIIIGTIEGIYLAGRSARRRRDPDTPSRAVPTVLLPVPEQTRRRFRAWRRIHRRGCCTIHTPAWPAVHTAQYRRVIWGIGQHRQRTD